MRKLILKMHKSCMVYFVKKDIVTTNNPKTQAKTLDLIYYYKMIRIIILKKMWMEIILLFQRNLKRK